MSKKIVLDQIFIIVLVFLLTVGLIAKLLSVDLLKNSEEKEVSRKTTVTNGLRVTEWQSYMAGGGRVTYTIDYPQGWNITEEVIEGGDVTGFMPADKKYEGIYPIQISTYYTGQTIEQIVSMYYCGSFQKTCPEEKFAENVLIGGFPGKKLVPVDDNHSFTIMVKKGQFYFVLGMVPEKYNSTQYSNEELNKIFDHMTNTVKFY